MLSLITNRVREALRSIERRKTNEKHLTVVKSASRRQDNGQVNLSLLPNYHFYAKKMESEAIFSVKTEGKEILVCLNENHPLFSRLCHLIPTFTNTRRSHDANSENEIKEALCILIASWAQYESELPVGRITERAEDARKDWGRVAARIFRER